MSMQRIVVVGNGIAGQTACDTLRAGGFEGQLSIIGEEPHPTYSRPALSKALLQSGGTVDAHQLPDSRHGAEVLLGRAATGLDPDRRLVELDDGEIVPYDGLVIASGSRARHLPGFSGSGERPDIVLRTLDDALALKKRLLSRPSVLVVGGGPLGMEVASGALDSGCEVTLICSGAPLSSQLGGYLSALFLRAALSRGLKIVTDSRARLAGNDARVHLGDGTVLEADLLVSAIGDEPNVGWLRGTGLLTDGALHPDTRGRMRQDIVAAGDVAAFPTARGRLRIPLWTSAIDQAKTAALGLLQQDSAGELDILPYFWTEGFGLSLKVAGFTPVHGDPQSSQGSTRPDAQLLRWEHADGTGTAAAINYRIPIPKLRKLAAAGAALPAV